MPNIIKGHQETPDNLSIGAVNLTPDILRVLEETREGAMEELDAIGDLPETENLFELFGLESEDFRLDSKHWGFMDSNIGRIKYKDTQDIFEVLEGPFAGEQYFTQDAARRELGFKGKKMPSPEEWLAILKKINKEIIEPKAWTFDMTVKDILGLKLAGFRSHNTNKFSGQYEFGCYWTSEIGKCVKIGENSILPEYEGSPLHFYLVRCLKD